MSSDNTDDDLEYVSESHVMYVDFTLSDDCQLAIDRELRERVREYLLRTFGERCYPPFVPEGDESPCICCEAWKGFDAVFPDWWLEDNT